MWKGLNWPFEKTSDGYFELVDYEEKILASVKQILFTRIGERVMLPEFGSRIMELVHEPLTEEMIAEAIISVREALKICEPRISVTDVVASVQDSKVIFDISYVIKGIEEKEQKVAVEIQ